MKLIFKYIDYRMYLHDFYEENKKSMRNFSYRYFALKAGVKSPIFLKQVIEGERNLTLRMIDQFIPALGLTKKESLFFKNLVLFNQAKNAIDKQEHYGVMLTMMDYITEHQLGADQYLYFEKWYISVVRELVCLYPFKNDFDLIARAVLPPIKFSEAKKAVELLLRLNLIVRTAHGTFRQSDSAIISADPMIALARRSFNSQMIERALEANTSIPPSERNISGITMGISKTCFDVIVAEMAAFKERIKMIVNQDCGSDRVYQLNLQLFPLSSDVPVISRKGKDGTACEK